MTRYRVFYLKDRQIPAYRESTPRPQPYHLRPSDYEEGPEIEAPSPYAVWKTLEETEEQIPAARKMVVGDVLQLDPSSILVMNFWGFDEAKWQESDPASRGPGEKPSSASQEPSGAVNQEMETTAK
jgi:hypothetical protein